MNIPEVYQNLQQGKHTNRHWMLLCPFHDDNKPSMTVDKDGEYAGHYKCWACDARGSEKTFARKMGLRPVTPNRPTKRRRTNSKPKLTAKQLAGHHVKCMLYKDKTVFGRSADKLGINCEILRRLHVGFDGRAYSFPMFGADNELTGIRLRTLDGKKYSYRGGENGLFVPLWSFRSQYPVIITEGESDCAAALQMGFQAIGIPGKSQCKGMLAGWLKNQGFDSAVIVADNDNPGEQGAKDLAKFLAFNHAIATRIINPPNQYKDFRQWFNSGARFHEVASRINAAKYQIGSEVARTFNKLRIQIKDNKNNE